MVANVPLWWGMLTIEDAIHVWGQEVYENLSLAVNLKVLYKIKFIKKKKVNK
jgi:hypothetical protein